MRILRAFLFALVPVAIGWAQTLPSITTSSPLPNGAVNEGYSTTLSCINCKGDTWQVSSGSLPPSLSLDVDTGTISGTPSAAGSYGFTVTLYVATGPTGTNATFSLTINPALTISTTTIPGGTQGSAYSTTISASGGVGSYTWALTSSNNDGLSINSSGVISGTPTAAGAFALTVVVYDSTQTSVTRALTLSVASSAPPLAITTTSLPNGVVNQPYSSQVTCVNCSGATWSISGGSLPTGLSLNAQNGAITGTPTAAGSFTFQVALTPQESTYMPQPVTANLSITVVPGNLAITQSSVPVGFQNTPYSTTLTGSGGTPPYTWSFQTSGTDGLTINASTGVISGTPTATGQFSLGVEITDSNNLQATKNFSLTVAAALSIITSSLPNGTVNVVYPTQTLAVGGGQPPYRWTISTGTLPPGLTLDGVAGTISGTPTAAGAYPFTLSLTDYASNSAKANLSITITGGITITPTTLPGGTVGTAYSQTFTATGGTAPYTWSVAAGTLPAGLMLDAAGGAISGTPTTAGTSSFTVQATDSKQVIGQQALSIVIAAAPLSITTASLPNGTINTAYSQTLAAMGGVSPYTWSISAGTLPAGLALNASSGVLSGTPTTAATSSFTVEVTDSAKTVATKAFSIVIAAATPPLAVTAAALPNATVGTAYSQTPLTVTGGVPPYKYALSSTSNDGISINASTGAISGTPASAGSFTLTAVVTDSATPQGQATASLPLTVNNPPLTVTAAALPNATVGTAYSQSPLTVTGGVPPYKYALSSTNNDGLSINASTGAISGTPTSAGSFTLTAVVTDSATPAGQAMASLPLTVNNPPPPTPTPIVTGVPATSGFMQQIPATISISSAYSAAISGMITLQFFPSVTPSTGVDDLMIQFSSGSRVINFTIPAGSTTATLTGATSVTVLTGTTAGTITLTTVLTANGQQLGNPLVQTIVDAAGVPFISKVTLTQVPGGVNVVVTGFSSTRDMINGQFAFTPATNDAFTSDNVSVTLGSAFTTWYSNTSQSNAYGTQFTLTVPFTTDVGSNSFGAVSVVAVTVTLENSKGASNPVSLSQ